MDSKYDSLCLKNQLCFPLYVCAKEVIRRYKPLLDELDLTYTQYVVMMYMWEKESSNVKDMGKALLLDSGTLTPLLKKLESKGFITRVRSKVDERNLDIEITKEGMALRDKALTVPEEMSKCVALTREEAETLCHLMRKVLAHIEAE